MRAHELLEVPISRLRSVSLDTTNEIEIFAGFNQGFDITEIGQTAATVNHAALIEPEPAFIDS